jgi:hypothetical protein
VLGVAEKYKEGTFVRTQGRILPSSVHDIAAEILRDSSQVSACFSGGSASTSIDAS